MEAIKVEFGLRTSATTPGLLSEGRGDVCSYSLSKDTNAKKIARAWHCPWAEEEDEQTTMIARC